MSVHRARTKAFARHVAIAALAAGLAGVSAGHEVSTYDERAQIRIAASESPSGMPGARDGLVPAAGTYERPEPRTAGIKALWTQDGAAARMTLLLLGALLAGTTYVAGRRLWDQHAVLASAATVRRSFWTAPNLYEAVRTLERNSPFRAVAEAALDAAAQSGGPLAARIKTSEWIARSLRHSVRAIEERLERGLPLIRNVTATAPLIGVCGTLWSAHRALIEQPEPAGPIGAALLMTAAGLAVAVLATAAVRWLGQRNARAASAVRDFAADMQALLVAADPPVTHAPSTPRALLPRSGAG